MTGGCPLITRSTPRWSLAALLRGAGPTPRRSPHAARRRAAISVATGALLLIASQVGTGVAIEAEWSSLRDPVFYDKLDLLRAHPAFFSSFPDRPVTVLFIGSSRTQNGVDAGAASRQLTAALGRPVQTFNFAQAGAGPVTNAVYMRRLLRSGVRTDFALIEVHPVFLAGQRPDPPETRWLLPFRLRRDELAAARATGFPAATPATHGPRMFAAPWYEYRFIVLNRYAPFLLMDNNRLNGGHQPDRDGFTRLQEHVSAEAKAGFLGLAWGQYADYFRGYRPNGPGVAAVRDTLEQCRSAGWKAALVLMPESETWRGWYDPAGLRELDAVVAGIGAEYGVPVFDARTWVPDELTVDGHHLAGPGADLLTERLTREALAPWLANSLAVQPGRTP